MVWQRNIIALYYIDMAMTILPISLWSVYLPVASLAGVVSVEGDGGLQVLDGADLGTQAQVRRGEHGLRPRARDVGHRGGHVWIDTEFVKVCPRNPATKWELSAKRVINTLWSPTRLKWLW